jgi:perosamine synthetase
MTKSIQIPLARPRLSDDDIQAAVEVLKTGYLVSGPVVEKFEKELAEYIGVRHVVCVSSGTAALQLGLLALGIGRGDDIIVPAFSYPATANVVELVGARPVFVDSELGGFNIDAGRIENCITPKTRGIMVVHNMGWPADMDRILNIARKYNFPVFEDAACALGSSFDGKRCGGLGKIAAFSFHPRKALTTGEGGAIATDDMILAERVKQLRNHGQVMGSKIEFVLAGFNYRLTEFQAAMGISQLGRFNHNISLRQAVAKYYDYHLAQFPFLETLSSRADCFANYQTYAAYVKKNKRDKLIEHLKENGIGAGIGTYSIPHTRFYRQKYNVLDSDFPNSYQSYSNLISLPLYEGITTAEQDKVIDTIRFFQSAKDNFAANSEKNKGKQLNNIQANI